MMISPEDKKEVLSMVADRLVEAIRKDAGGDLSAFVIMPMASASQMLCLSARQIKRIFPITRTSAGKQGITLKAIREHILRNTSMVED